MGQTRTPVPAGTPAGDTGMAAPRAAIGPVSQAAEAGERADATVVDVARRAGVSVATVSRYLNGQRIRKAQSVQSAIEAVGFRPNNAARALKSGRRDTIALLAPDPTNPLLIRSMRGAQNALAGSRYRLLMYASEPGEERSTVFDIAGRVDGVILSPHSWADPTATMLADAGVPVVLLNAEVEDAERFDRVLADNARGVRLAVDYLIKLGHRNIAAIHLAPRHWVGRERARAFRDALRRHEVPLCPEYDEEVEAPAATGRQTGYNEMLRLLTLPHPPTAVFCAAVTLTVGALHALRDVNVTLPHGVSLVGFGDHELFDLMSPGITVITHAAEAQGARTIKMLIEQIDGNGSEIPRREIIGTELVVRGSCAIV